MIVNRVEDIVGENLVAVKVASKLAFFLLVTIVDGFPKTMIMTDVARPPHLDRVRPSVLVVR